jgi:hypothetical protein
MQNKKNACWIPVIETALLNYNEPISAWADIPACTVSVMLFINDELPSSLDLAKWLI